MAAEAATHDSEPIYARHSREEPAPNLTRGRSPFVQVNQRIESAR